mgnify:CR=1 FL=1
MKRIFSPILSLLVMLTAFSCNDYVADMDQPDRQAVLGVAAFENGVDLGNTVTYEVGKRQSKTVSLKAFAEEVPGVSLKISFGVDPALVDVYNEANGTSYEVLPGDAYKFGEQDVIMPRFNQYSAESKFTLIGQGCVEDQFYILPVVITKVNGSENYVFSETKQVVYFLMKVLPSNKGTGLKTDPFLIQELEDIKTMHEKMIPGETVYFKLEADIDMTPVTGWAPLNASSPFDKAIHFDGNGHTISNFTADGGNYVSFFGILNGIVENVTFDNATISSTSHYPSVVASYIGESGINGTARNIKILNSTITTTKNRPGILCGELANATVENIYAENCVVVGARYSGLLIGAVGTKGTATVRNCWVKGGSIYGSQQVGAIMGVAENDCTIEFCGPSADVTGQFGIGGILGRGDKAGKHKIVKNCVVWSDKVWCDAVTPGDLSHYSSGIVVGTARKGEAPYTFMDCVYRSGIKFQDYTDLNPLVDSPNVENGAVAQAAAGGDHNYPWNGVASTAKTASEAAKALGWDEAIWDLSGDEPKLK